MNKISEWVKENPTFSTVVAVCATVALVAAMYFKLDLSWIPAMLTKLIGG